jgi:Mlc titration factor MtfA (ptsG expression regulator)
MIYFFLAVLVFGLVGIILVKSISLIDHLLLYVYKKPIFVHFYFRLKKLPYEEERFIKDRFPFYNRLNSKEKLFFQHRVILFMKDKSFEGRDGFEVTKEVKLYVASTAVMLTFGMRSFLLPALQKIFIYPSVYHSTINQAYHKGEFNPRLKALVFSWEDFLAGFKDDNDNLNLAIHEFIHVLQINSMKQNDVSATIFADCSKELIAQLLDEDIRKRLHHTKYFREYAFTNRFEFLAVLVEYFIETPVEFKQKFPEFYVKIREMLNYNFSGY